MRDLEDVLLTCHTLVNSSVGARIFPDKPWAERQKRKSDPVTSRQSDAKKVLLVHGVPELKNADKCEQQKHDIEEWRYITEIYNIPNVVTVNVSRLAVSLNYRGTGPSILKVTLATSDMVSAVLASWYDNRKCGPPDIRLRPFLQTVVAPATSAPDSVGQILDTQITNVTVTKNVNSPALIVPVVSC